ncbi:hypothetical protein RJ640_023535, partial [Escallonia rubra]
VQRLKKELGNAQKSRKAASASLRMALQKAAQLRLMEKEKNKSPSYAMRISLQINKVVWGMLVDGKSFAEAEINDMIYDFDRDYKDVGVARFTTKYFVVRNCLPNAKSDMLLSAWNPPSEWGNMWRSKHQNLFEKPYDLKLKRPFTVLYYRGCRKVMLRVDAKQGAPKDGNSPLELFQVEIFPLKIHLTETMYRMMWEYFFPEEEQDSQRRQLRYWRLAVALQEVWKVSTTAGSRRAKKGSSAHDASTSSSHSMKEFEVSSNSSTSALPSTSGTSQSLVLVESSQGPKLPNQKANLVCGSTPELRRTSSFDRTWEETVAESVANELVLQVHSSNVSSSKSGGPQGSVEQQEEPNKSKSKDTKPKSGRSSHEEKKVGKAQEEKRSRPRRMREFHNIKISQVELLVTYEGSRFAVSDLSGAGVPDSDLNLSDSDGGSAGKSDQYPISWPKRPSDGAGDGFVTSIRGLFNSQRRKAKAFVLRTMRGEAENEIHGEWSLPSQQRESLPSSPRETTAFESDSSSGTSPYEDFHE